MDDATLSRLANFMRKLGGGKITLYAVSDRQHSVCILVASTCAEEAIKVIREETGLREWSMANTNTRSVQRNIDAAPGVVAAFSVDRDRPIKRSRSSTGSERENSTLEVAGSSPAGCAT